MQSSAFSPALGKAVRLGGLVALWLLSACGGGGAGTVPATGGSPAPAPAPGLPSSDFGFLPAHFPKPFVPADNPLTPAKVELGRRLFYDTRLSGNGTQSCGTCHLQSRAFTDGLSNSTGSTGSVHPRNSQSLTNIAYNITFNWGDPSLRTLEVQNATPIVNTNPVELGVNEGNRATVLGRFKADADYVRRFAEVFPGEADPVTLPNIAKALATFSRTLISYRAPFDRFEAGDASALSDSAKRGLALFESERLECNACHGGFNFSDSSRVSGVEEPVFHNTGLYNITNLDGSGNNYPAQNQGVFEITGNVNDKGKMRAPTLRNIALTAPYNHDGSVATLSEVIDNYARGGRLVTSPLTRFGDGRTNVNKDGEIHGFTLSAAEKADLIAFLESLTDTAFTTDPALSNPFP